MYLPRWGGFRKWTDADHHTRDDTVMFGSVERGVAPGPPSRTHEGMLADGRANERHVRAVKSRHDTFHKNRL